MKRFGLLVLVLLFGFSGAAFAAEGLTVINQTGLAISATLTQSAALTQPLKPNQAFVFGPFPQPQYTLNITAKNVRASKAFGPEIKYATFRRAGQVYQIFVSATPPTTK